MKLILIGCYTELFGRMISSMWNAFITLAHWSVSAGRSPHFLSYSGRQIAWLLYLLPACDVLVVLNGSWSCSWNELHDKLLTSRRCVFACRPVLSAYTVFRDIFPFSLGSKPFSCSYWSHIQQYDTTERPTFEWTGQMLNFPGTGTLFIHLARLPAPLGMVCMVWMSTILSMPNVSICRQWVGLKVVLQGVLQVFGEWIRANADLAHTIHALGLTRTITTLRNTICLFYKGKEWLNTEQKWYSQQKVDSWRMRMCKCTRCVPKTCVDCGGVSVSVQGALAVANPFMTFSLPLLSTEMIECQSDIEGYGRQKATSRQMSCSSMMLASSSDAFHGLLFCITCYSETSSDSMFFITATFLWREQWIPWKRNKLVCEASLVSVPIAFRYSVANVREKR